MKRADGLSVLSRRQFCAFAGLAAAAGISACTDGDTGAIQTGPLGASDEPLPDAGVATPDAGTSAGVCGTGATDVGLASSFTLNTPVYNSTLKCFVVRDSGGLYALTARCTHEGVVCGVSGTQFRCPRHGALFTFNGAIIAGPVSKPLVHYAMCTLAGGRVGVIPTMQVAASTRLVA